jgi:RHS repeat-associated protein
MGRHRTVYPDTGYRAVLDETLWRKYDSSSGRWTTPDPYNGSMTIADPQSFNRYAYVGNDPINFVDPSGLDDAPNCGAGRVPQRDALGQWQCVGTGTTNVTVTIAFDRDVSIDFPEFYLASMYRFLQSFQRSPQEAPKPQPQPRPTPTPTPQQNPGSEPCEKYRRGMRMDLFYICKGLSSSLGYQRTARYRQCLQNNFMYKPGRVGGYVADPLFSRVYTPGFNTAGINLLGFLFGPIVHLECLGK